MTSSSFNYLALSGVCNNPRGDSTFRINTVSGPDSYQELASTNIRNQFNTRPICFAFIVNDIKSETVLMHANDEALITFDQNLIMLTLGGKTAIFTSLNLVGETNAQRVQICVDDTGNTGARLYQDCNLIETVQFSTEGIPPVTSVSVLMNETTPFDVSKN